MTKLLTQYGDRIMAGIVAVGLGLSLWFGVRPAYQALVAARADLERGEIAYEVQADRLFRWQTIKADQDAVDAAVAELPQMPIAEDMVRIVEELESVAQTRGVTVAFTATDEAPAKKKEKDERTGSRLTATVTGPLRSVLAFLRGVENQPVPISVDEIIVGPSVTLTRQGSDVLTAIGTTTESAAMPEATTVTATVQLRVPVRSTESN